MKTIQRIIVVSAVNYHANPPHFLSRPETNCHPAATVDDMFPNKTDQEPFEFIDTASKSSECGNRVLDRELKHHDHLQ